MKIEDDEVSHAIIDERNNMIRVESVFSIGTATRVSLKAVDAVEIDLISEAKQANVEAIRRSVRRRQNDLAKQLHAKFSLTGYLAWSEVEALLVELCGPLNRRKRCQTCGGEGRLYSPTEPAYAYGYACVACEGTGYQKGGE